MTPKQRASLSRRTLLRLARLMLPFIGAPVTKALLDVIAKASFADVNTLRSGYRSLAAQAAANQLGRDTVSAPPDIRRYEVADWRKAVGRAFQEDAATPDTKVDRPAIARALVRADLHGRNAERNTMVAIAIAEDEVIGWARVDPTPPTCPLCRLTISRGPVYSSAEAAGGEGNTYHGGCTCTIVLVTAGSKTSWPGYEQYQAELRRYREAKGKPKAYRAAVAKANKDAGPGVTKQAADDAAGIQKESD